MSRWLALGAGVVFLSALPRALHAPTRTAPRIVIVVPSQPGSWLLGARLGTEEALRSAEHMRRELHLVEIVPARKASPTKVVRAAVEAGTVVAIAAEPGEALDALESAAVSSDLVLLDARPRYPRDAPCLPRVFRLGLAWGPQDSGDGPALWHRAVSAEGAAELAERFRRRFAQPMDGAAWAGWFAVKVAAAATLGLDAPDPGTVEGFLRSRAASFDGHKGEPLRFHAVERRLIQPAYVAGEGGGGAEVRWPVTTGCGAAVAHAPH